MKRKPGKVELLAIDDRSMVAKQSDNQQQENGGER